jgi:hypothetical protein
VVLAGVDTSASRWLLIHHVLNTVIHQVMNCQGVTPTRRLFTRQRADPALVHA